MTWKEAATHVAMSGMAVITALALTPPSAAAQPVPSPDDPRWGCYDPAPGHPTDDERKRFVAEIAPAALSAEHTGRPPATGIAAMAALESGFGWTRTSMFAKNLFGWKYINAAAARGRRHWTLSCQPASDPGNDYVTFRDHADSVTFVAGKLAKNARYAPSTQRYRKDLRGGTAPEAALEDWVRDIAAIGYNPSPSYPGSVMAIARKISLPGRIGQVSASSPSHAEPVTTPQAPRQRALKEQTGYLAVVAAIGQRLDPGARAMDRCVDGSGQVSTTWPGYENLPVKRCIFVRRDPGDKTSSKALAYVLHPSKEQLANAIAVACTRGNLGDPVVCATRLFERIFRQSNAMYPVAGYVLERGAEGGCDGHAMRAIYFRDGIAATLPGRPFCQPLPDIATSESDTKRDDYVFAFESRLSSIHPSDFIRQVPRTSFWHAKVKQFKPTHVWGEMARKDHVRWMTGGSPCFLHLAAARLMHGTPDTTLCDGL